VKNKDQFIGSLYINLNALQLSGDEKYTPFSVFNKNNKDDIYADYSYAFYRNRKLIKHNGSYIYKIINVDFIFKPKKFFTLSQDQYEHLIYSPNFNNTIVITHKKITFWRELAALSFFFIIFLITAIVIYSYRWVFSSIYISNISLKNIQKKLLAFNNRILYKTRIQIALVLAVVSSLFIIGIITFSYISIQYKDQQKEFLSNRIRIITESFQDNLAGANQAKNLDNSSLSFQDFSKLYGADINLFNLKGKLISTTKSNLFDDGLLAQRMNPIAFIKLNIDKNSEYIQEETLATLDYTSAYMPIKSIDHNVLGYLQVPYFSNQEDYNQKIGSFLNLLINIYVLVFLAVGFFAFVVANQITGPLSLIQKSISTTMIGRKNKPIAWKRNDEIGTLILEYNNMIAKLEENANKLAQSERETAWREMAKQVAHEIKNPLTPLRLGIQMLDRSWKEKDPKFDDKFVKFSKSFIEQIDSLSRIASEFSNFAKMPQLKLEEINLMDLLSKAIDVYGQMENIQIICKEDVIKLCVVNADRDQLLRSFNNVLKNAIEAIPQDKAGIIIINGTIVNHNVQITVSDNGTGIPLNLRENIFAPNFTTKSSGTGLGLAFVKQAIENMKGNIYFTTEINVGTTFYITLPLV
jgi:signal transduction histidine kinase